MPPNEIGALLWFATGVKLGGSPCSKPTYEAIGDRGDAVRVDLVKQNKTNKI